MDEKTVNHVSRIARINLTNEEIKEFIPQFNEILNMFSELNKINTDNVKPSFHPLPTKNVLRDDIPEPCFTNEEALKNTDHKEKGFFKAPRIL